MSIYALDPLQDPRWPEFLEQQSSASVFHSRGWLAALQRTYGYEPIAYTTSPPGAHNASTTVGNWCGALTESSRYRPGP